MKNAQKKHKLELFLPQKKIQAICRDLADQINQDYKRFVVGSAEDHTNPDVIAIGILKGSLFFMADVLRLIDIPFVTDFVKLSSYGKDMEACGTVTILQDISTDIRGKHVIIFDEIVDSGRTLAFYIERLKVAGPASVKVCTLIDKKICRFPDITINADYVGINADEQFLVGYGLDHAEQYRNLPDIYQLKED